MQYINTHVSALLLCTICCRTSNTFLKITLFFLENIRFNLKKEQPLLYLPALTCAQALSRVESPPTITWPANQMRIRLLPSLIMGNLSQYWNYIVLFWTLAQRSVVFYANLSALSLVYYGICITDIVKYYRPLRVNCSIHKYSLIVEHYEKHLNASRVL